MNPRNVLRELLRLYEASHANDEDRAMVCDEAIVMLSGDPVLNPLPTDHFSESTKDASAPLNVLAFRSCVSSDSSVTFR